MLLHQPVDYHAQRRPTHGALAAHDHHWDYATLVSRSHAVAHLLLEAGVKPEERVGVLGLNSAAHFAVLLGASRVGAVTVSVNFRLAPAELAFILDDAEIDLLFVTDDSINDIVDQTIALRDKATRLIADRESVYRPLAQVMSQDVEPYTHGAYVDERSPALQLYTSGTTGKPKGAVLSHRNVLSLTQMMGLSNDGLYNADTVNLIVAPLFHIGGTGVTYIGLAHGCHNIMHESFDPLRVVEAIQEHRVTSMFMVPAMIQAIVKLVPNVRDYDFSSLEIIAYGASPISATLLEEALSVFGCRFSQVYGMTETSGTVVALSPEDHLRAVEGASHLLTSCGKPCPGNEVKIIDENGTALGANQTGEICLRSASNMLGYYNRDEATANTIKEGWVLTGDAGFMDDDGYLFLRDRIKDMVVSGGENIYPVEVENVLSGIPGVVEVAVIGVPDETYGEALLAIFAMKPEHSIDAEGMIAFCRDKLAGYKIPRRLECVDALPRNPSGKILKTELREPYWAGIDRRIS
ncbi:MAG: long-chain-fatty-acid--CoA ligase [Luminiphilus sp.]|nr:long-chain-fatty-acid--CoA ligase [Luminiphilus sp.]